MEQSGANDGNHWQAQRPRKPPSYLRTRERLLASSRDVKRRDRLGGLIHEYSYAA